MTAPARSEHQPPNASKRPGIPDDALSPEEREELDAFRRMSKLSRQTTKEWMERLIKPAE